MPLYAPSASVPKVPSGQVGALDALALPSDLAVVTGGFARTGVLSGCSVTQHGAPSAPTFRAGSAFSTNGAFVASLIVTIPAAVAVGDFMIVGTCNSGAGFTSSAPAGWTRLRGDSTTSVSTELFYKVAVAGDTGGSSTVTFTTNASNRQSLCFVAYAGASGVINISGGTTATGVITANSPSLTTTVNNTTVVEFFGQSPVTGALTGPVTQRVMEHGGSFCSSCISDQVQAVAGATPAQSCTSVSATSNWGIESLALVGAPATPNMSVDVASGVAFIAGVPVTAPAAGGVAISAADPTNPRIDVVTVDVTGVPAVTTGTPAVCPVWPTVAGIVSGTVACLATVYVAAAVTSIPNTAILDKREIMPSTLTTVPGASHVDTVAFGALTLGTPIRNTLGHDILVTVSIPVTASTSGTIVAGVGTTSTPTTDPVTPALTGAVAAVTFTFYVPNLFYLSVTTSGTITAGTPVVVVTPV